jgi:hypothetical protein
MKKFKYEENSIAIIALTAGYRSTAQNKYRKSIICSY